MNKKKILAIALVLIVILLGGASIYVATQLSTREAVAPTAPESEPAAAEPIGAVTPTGTQWVGDPACTVVGTATAVETNVTVVKKASTYVDDATKTEGYTIKTDTDMATMGATFVYRIQVKNAGVDTVSGVVLSDTLTGGNLDKLTFVDSPASQSCSFDAATRKYSCAAFNLTAGQSIEKYFRVKVTGDFTAASTIDNTAIATLGSQTFTGLNSLRVEPPIVITLSGSKTAFKNETENVAGTYTLTSEMSAVSKSQIYVYSISLTNTGTANATSVVIKDSLKDMPVTFMDASAGCTWSATDTELTCNTTISPAETKKFNFRVKASEGVANGTVITNTGKVTFPGGTLNLVKDLTVSTVVGCNNTCTTNAECATGLTCDTTTSKCRTAACLAEDDCTCVTTTQTVVVTSAPTVSEPTPTQTVVTVVTTTPTPTILPEAGIFVLPGIAAFGGGLLLAIVGILLAL